jgi:bifunctional N-acetylglucosamine-1-phosphate-uridyltransferase/glucosamine-1-phosphate-acetyltransferase GlmU-like protein
MDYVNKRRIAVIAAGGFSSRMQSIPPKPLLVIGGQSYLSILLQHLNKVEVEHVAIYCNRESYFSQIEKTLSAYDNISIIFDAGVNSTIELVQHAASIFEDSSILFFYGHAPRPEQLIHSLINSGGECAAYTFIKSTKIDPVPVARGRYIEPPIRINTNNIELIESKSWKEYFNKLASRCVLIETNDPSEFNYPEEELVFRQYVETWHKDLTKCSSGHLTVAA